MSKNIGGEGSKNPDGWESGYLSDYSEVDDAEYDPETDLDIEIKNDTILTIDAKDNNNLIIIDERSDLGFDLRLAVNTRSFIALKAVIDANPDTKIQGNIKYTALIHAIDRGLANQDATIVRSLISRSANLDFSYNIKAAAAEYVLEKDNSDEILGILFSEEVSLMTHVDNTPPPATLTPAELYAHAIKAINIGDFQLLTALIREDVILDYKDTNGRTLLMAAVQKGDFGMVNLLIEAGANVTEFFYDNGHINIDLSGEMYDIISLTSNRKSISRKSSAPNSTKTF